MSNPARSRWYPTRNQTATPEATQAAFKQVLDQFYQLKDAHEALQASHAALQAKVEEKQSGPPPGSGPTDTQLCGLYVEPVDTNNLANGTALKFNKARGTFSFQ